ncbi:TetR/AcrR family transcriptional regulator [Acetobacter orleanensis]|uniref:TetR family transcriptional regulator n=1 Tax=Acetobacter orleanensis TaxID=104099 RepID=A0A4Y3TQP9_9PROT|nr:TetR/AcrR family transcriptional regulator [Acetobacter orleanensis]GAN69203.1 transcriptional regulator TetR [Acetobacter orleanensis JCM 7639]GBR25563.1 transcriptional regulator [Acetobacter orleanensis NRIC 0473]GEB84063.1 TetR family transcriptional regulator [Acetobacter orleanensis]
MMEQFNQTAEAIIVSAERLIREGGYNGFSFREIATEVGVKSASVHYHFATKSDLAATVARRYTERFMVAIDDAMKCETNVRIVWINAFRRALVEDGKMCLCAVLGTTSNSLPVSVQTETRRFFECALDKLNLSGLTETQSVHILSTLEGAMLLSLIFSKTSVFDQAVKELM